MLSICSCHKKQTKQTGQDEQIIPKISGCTNAEAINFNSQANEDDGSCVYTPIITNGSFESGNNWLQYSGNGYCINSNVVGGGNGFMPTNGNFYMQCIPNVTCQLGTYCKLYLNDTKHFKGIYFDYSCSGVASQDSNLTAKASINLLYPVYPGSQYLVSIAENKTSFGGFPIVNIQQQDAYLDFPYCDHQTELAIFTSVSKGTFIFCVDNIRLVPR